MKKLFRPYLIAWAILLAVYNAVVFALRPIAGSSVSYDARFWICWAFEMAAFAGQLGCAWVAFQAKNKEKLFLNIPLVRQSYLGVILLTIAGSICMLIPNCPAWIAAVCCILIFGFSAVALVKASAAAELVEEVDRKLRAQTTFIRTLTADAQTLLDSAADPQLRAELRRVSEQIRYSDPMSCPALADAERRILLAFGELQEAVAAKDGPKVSRKAEEVLLLVQERNRKCKLLK